MEQYIPKSVVVAEIERLITPENGYSMDKLLDFIDTLEVKEVNLDFEQELYKAFGQVKDFTLGMRIARHFFELGMAEKLLGKALDFIVETQEDNDYICEQMCEEYVGNYCANNCQNLNKECVKLFLEKVYKKGE